MIDIHIILIHIIQNENFVIKNVSGSGLPEFSKRRNQMSKIIKIERRDCPFCGSVKKDKISKFIKELKALIEKWEGEN